MEPLRDFLDRFRTVVAPPGPAAGRVMPPVDVRTRLEAELAPVFSIIDEVEERAGNLVVEAEEAARAMTAEARRKAAAAVAAAEAAVPDTRAAAVASRTGEIDVAIEAIRDAANDEAGRVASVVGPVADQLAQEVIHCVVTSAGDSP